MARSEVQPILAVLASLATMLAAIVAATPRGLARFWPAATSSVHALCGALPCRWSRVAKTVIAQRVFHYVSRS